MRASTVPIWVANAPKIGDHGIDNGNVTTGSRVRYADLLKLEKSIADADESTIMRRWSYGRGLLGDPADVGVR